MTKAEKILLVQPNLKWCDWNFKTLWEVTPANLCLLAATLEPDYDVQVLDANIDDISEEAFAQQVADLNPDVVGITMLTTEYAECAHRAAKQVKNASRRITTVLGGIYATVNFSDAVKDDHVDYLVVGEGEYVLRELLAYLNGAGPFPEAGVVFRRDGEVVETPRAPFIQDLDALPFPAYHKIDYNRYIYRDPRLTVDAPKRLPSARVRTSRGCPVGCCFCQVEKICGKRFRVRSVQNVIDELVWLKETYGIKSVLFNDDNLILDKRRAKMLFKAMIDSKLDLTWNATAIAVYRLDGEMLELMKESGCAFIDIAVESGVERILKDVIRKPVNLKHVKEMVQRTRQVGMDIVANFIIGFPTETWEEIRQTIKFAEDLEVDYVKIFIATPLSHTPLYDMIVAQNSVAEGTDIRTDVNWSVSKIASDEFTSKDLAVLRAYEWDRINFTDPARRDKIMRMMRTTPEELKDLRRRTLDSVKA